MAIPFHTPSEYGPVPLTVRNNNLPQDNGNNNNYVDLRRNRDEPQHHNNVPLNHYENAQEQLGFLRRLVIELSNVFDRYPATTMRNLERHQVRPDRDSLQAPPANRPFQHQQDQNNQTSASAGPSTPPRSPRQALPDIIQCHAQLAFNFCATANNTPNNTNNNFTNNGNQLPLPARVRAPSPQAMEHSVSEESLDISLKIGFEIYRKAGRDLRYIADDLEQNYNRGNRRRNIYRRSRIRLSLDMDVMLMVAFPALAILGGFGYYVFRR